MGFIAFLVSLAILILWLIPMIVLMFLREFSTFNQHQTILNLVLIKLYIWPFFISILFMDMLGVQGDLGPGILLFPFVLTFVPFITATLLIFYYAIFYFILYFLTQKFTGKNFNRIYIWLTLLSILLFQLLWWKVFYTPVSLPRRVLAWNIVTIVFPLLPLLALWIKMESNEDQA